MKNETKLWVLGHLISPYKTSGNYNLVIGESPAGAQGPPPHSHNTYNEVFLVLEGEMEFVIDGVAQTANAGDCIDLPKGSVHTFNNKGEKPCKWVNIHSPKGFQSFFDTFGVPAGETGALEQSLDPGRIQSVVEQAVNFDMELSLP